MLNSNGNFCTRVRAVILKSRALSLLFLSFCILFSCAKEGIRDKIDGIGSSGRYAVISFGPLCQLQAIEGTIVRKTGRTVYVEPGVVKIRVSYGGEIMGDMVYYTDELVELSLHTRSGQRYTVTGEVDYPVRFRVRVLEDEEREVLLSVPVELKVKWIMRRKD